MDKNLSAEKLKKLGKAGVKVINKQAQAMCNLNNMDSRLRVKTGAVLLNLLMESCTVHVPSKAPGPPNNPLRVWNCTQAPLGHPFGKQSERSGM